MRAACIGAAPAADHRGLRRLCVIRRSIHRLAVARLSWLRRLRVSGSGQAICGHGRTVGSRLTIWLGIAIRTVGNVVALRVRGMSLHRLLRCILVGIVRLRCRLIAAILELSEISLGRIIRRVIVVLSGIVVAGIVVTHVSNNIP